MILTECRRNRNHPLDKQVSTFDRAATFEAGLHLTDAVVLSPMVVDKVRAACNTIVEHFQSTGPGNSRIWLAAELG